MDTVIPCGTLIKECRVLCYNSHLYSNHHIQHMHCHKNSYVFSNHFPPPVVPGSIFRNDNYPFPDKIFRSVQSHCNRDPRHWRINSKTKTCKILSEKLDNSWLLIFSTLWVVFTKNKLEHSTWSFSWLCWGYIFLTRHLSTQ